MTAEELLGHSLCRRASPSAVSTIQQLVHQQVVTAGRLFSPWTVHCLISMYVCVCLCSKCPSLINNRQMEGWPLNPSKIPSSHWSSDFLQQLSLEQSLSTPQNSAAETAAIAVAVTLASTVAVTVAVSTISKKPQYL